MTTTTRRSDRQCRTLVRFNGGRTSLPPVAVILLCAHAAWGQCEHSKLTPTDAGDEAAFGTAAALAGDVAMVGAPGDDEYGDDAGAVYLHRFDGRRWQEDGKLTAFDTGSDDEFGCAIAMTEDLAVVGARGDADRWLASGAAYVFRLNGQTWEQEAKFTAPVEQAAAQFGYAVAVGDGVIAIGAPYDHESFQNNFGTVYVYRFDGFEWSLDAALQASDAADYDRFGIAIALDGDRLLIGADSDDDAGEASGAAYLFEYADGHWMERTKLVASDAELDDFFGGAVSLDGDLAAIGAYSDVNPRGHDCGAVYIFRRNGDDWVEEEKLVPSDGDWFDAFGRALVAHGDVIAVGSPYDDDGGSAAGAVYVYRRENDVWIHTAKLTASDADVSDWFGLAIALDGGRGIIGASGKDLDGDDAGAAYLFEGFPDIELNKTTLQDGLPFDRFGASVATYGDTLLIGRPRAAFPGSGEIYRLEHGEWKPEARLEASDRPAQQRFGQAVSIHDGVCVLGAPLDDDGGENAGAAYVFRHDGQAWVQEAKLVASDSAAGDSFGSSVSISDRYLVVGAYLRDDAGDSSGAAYVFHFDGQSWVEQARLTASDAAAGDQFGRSVTIDGNTVAIGARFDDDRGSSSGSVYVFRRSGQQWSQTEKIVPLDGRFGDHFGTSVSLLAEVLAVGTPGDDDVAPTAGAVYVYVYESQAWNQAAKLTPVDEPLFAELGWAVSLAPPMLLAGAPRHDGGANHGGAAYLYGFDGQNWRHQARLIPSDVEADDNFGSSVALGRAVGVIASPEDDDRGSGAGAVYLFQRAAPCDLPVGDLDGDRDVDLHDHRLLTECMGGPGVVEPPQGCTPEVFNRGDLDLDQDLDIADFREFQRVFGGP